MATSHVSLPDELPFFVNGEVPSGDDAAVVPQPSRPNQRRADVRKMLLDGVTSESAGPYDDAFRARMRERASAS